MFTGFLYYSNDWFSYYYFFQFHYYQISSQKRKQYAVDKN